MIDRQSAGLLPDKPHTTLRDKDGNLFYEEMHTRGGFGGPFSYFYHRYPTTPHTELGLSERGYRPPTAPSGPVSPLRHRDIAFKHWNLHIFHCGKSGQQMKRLEKETDLSRAIP